MSVFLWVELYFFSLECIEVSSNEFGDVYGFVATLGSLYIGAQGCVFVLLENLRGMSCSGACWPLCGAWFQCRYGGHLSCSFICWVFLYLFILFKLLSLGCHFCILAVCGVLFIVAFPRSVWVCTGDLSRFLG